MNAGLYKEKISIFREEKHVNDYGLSINGSFRNIKTTRARVVYRSGSRATDNNNTVYDVSYTFYVHRYVDILFFDRILYKGDYYRIINIEDNRLYNDKIILTEKIND